MQLAQQPGRSPPPGPLERDECRGDETPREREVGGDPRPGDVLVDAEPADCEARCDCGG